MARPPTPLELRDRVLGPIATSTGVPPEDVATVNFGDLIRKLILCERVIVESQRLKEVPAMVRKFGYDGVKELLESGRIRFTYELLSVTEVGQLPDWIPNQRRGGILPFGSYYFAVVRSGDHKALIHDALQEFNTIPGLTDRQRKKLRKLVGERVMPLAADLGQPALDQLAVDLGNNIPALRQGIAVATREFFRIEVDPKELELRVEQADEKEVWTAESNLSDLTGLNEQQLHEAVQRGLMGVGGVDLRLELMKRHDAVSGFRVNELPVFDEKVAFLAAPSDPEVQTKQLEKVIELAGLPECSDDPDERDVNLAKLLEVTSGEEVMEFRRWVRTLVSATDEEIANQLHPIRDALGEAVRSGPGKAVRFAATAGLGVVAPPAGIAAGLLDTFVTEKVIAKPGPTAFLSRRYPTIFDA